MIHKKKAFTLTELLVVVIVIGILSAVVLPKFSKVVETRKTTEAENLMAAVRTEQEKRCALDKKYITDFVQITDKIPSRESKNYSYSLTTTGMQAQSKGKYGYTLKMPSYADGRLCCENEEECAKLNKDYPLCSELIARADYQSGAECAGPPIEIQCSGSATQACGCQNKGTQTRTCDTTTGQWGSWGACSVSDTCECTGTKPATSETCNTCGTRTRTVSCDASTGEWVAGAWGSCSKTASECSSSGSGSSKDELCNVDFSNMAYMGRWDYCCASEPTSNTKCYKTCSSSSSTPNFGSTSTSYRWSDSSTACSTGGSVGNVGTIANAISCMGITCSASFAGQSCCNNGKLRTCVAPSSGGGGSTTTTTTYYCAKYATCSTSCEGYQKGSTSSSSSGGSSGGSFGGSSGGSFGGSSGGSKPPITPPGSGSSGGGSSGGSSGGSKPPSIRPPGSGSSGGGAPSIYPGGSSGGGFGGSRRW